MNRALLLTLVMLMTSAAHAAPSEKFDVVVYGGTSAGVAAAVQVARMGRTVVVIEPGKHLGGLTSGGLGATDIGNKAAIGGISREFYALVYEYYTDAGEWNQQTREEYFSALSRRAPSDETMWTFEPHAAEEIFEAMLARADVGVVYEERLDLDGGVRTKGRRIRSITMESGRAFRADMFIDATYEGDLMALAGVSYHVGRESNDTYGETLNGVQVAHDRYHQFEFPVSPYVTPNDPSSGLLPRITDETPLPDGSGDDRVQAYCFRMCLTDAPENRVPFPKPEGYDPLQYELLLRYLQGGRFDVFGNHQQMPNRKTDTNNNGAYASDNIGMNYDYPDGDYATREAIIEEHRTYQQGLMWFLANDPRVPDAAQEWTRNWGLPEDEFVDNGHWPHQLYIREARRMVGDYVMTEQNCRGSAVAEDPVALGAYGMDSHNTQRYVTAEGNARNEGDVEVGGFSPYPVSYRSIVPNAKECANLLVPVCLSASHIAFGSIRMEPVFMITGQSAATAAVHAIEEESSVQKIDYDRLRERLLDDGQVLEWTGPRRVSRIIEAKSLDGVVVDDAEAELTGEWKQSTVVSPYVGSGYLHDDNSDKGEMSARFEARLPASGRYEVRVCYSANENRASNVPVSIEHAGGSDTVLVNQRETPPIDDAFASLGAFEFARRAVVTIGNADTDGHVIVDAVQLVPIVP